MDGFEPTVTTMLSIAVVMASSYRIWSLNSLPVSSITSQEWLPGS